MANLPLFLGAFGFLYQILLLVVLVLGIMALIKYLKS